MPSTPSLAFRIGGAVVRGTPIACRGGALIVNLSVANAVHQACVTADNAVDEAEFWRVLAMLGGEIVDEDGDPFPG